MVDSLVAGGGGNMDKDLGILGQGGEGKVGYESQWVGLGALMN